MAYKAAIQTASACCFQVGVTPLHLAAKHRHASVVEALLSANANVNVNCRDKVRHWSTRSIPVLVVLLVSHHKDQWDKNIVVVNASAECASRTVSAY